MKTYKIPVGWTMWGIMEVEANSLKEAERVALEDAPLPTDGEYVEDSIILDKESELYPEENKGGITMKNTIFTLDKVFLLATRGKDTSLVNQLITEYHNECLPLPILAYQGGEKCMCNKLATQKVRGEKYYCDACSKDLFVCDICGDINPFGTVIEGKHYCVPCYKKYNGSRCVHCNFPTEQTYKGEFRCKECYNLRFHLCCSCMEIFPYEELERTGDSYRCVSCYKETEESKNLSPIRKLYVKEVLHCSECPHSVIFNHTFYCKNVHKYVITMTIPEWCPLESV